MTYAVIHLIRANLVSVVVLALIAASSASSHAPDWQTSGRVLDGTNSTVKMDQPGVYAVTFQPAEWPNMSIVPASGRDSWDWTGAGALAFAVTNPGNVAAELGVRVDDDARSDGVVHCRTGKCAVPPGKTAHFAMTFGPDP